MGEDASLAGVGGSLRFFVSRRRPVERASRRCLCGVYPERALFVDVRVAHRDHHRVDGDVHHDDVQDLQTDTQV